MSKDEEYYRETIGVRGGFLFGYFLRNPETGMNAARIVEAFGSYAREVGIVERSNPSGVTVYSVSYKISDWSGSGFPKPDSHLQKRDMKFIVSDSYIESIIGEIVEFQKQGEISQKEVNRLGDNLNNSYYFVPNPLPMARSAFYNNLERLKQDSRSKIFNYLSLLF